MAKRKNIEQIALDDAEKREFKPIEKKIDTSTMVQTNFRIDPDFKISLTKHFKTKGLAFGSGVRMVLMDYMKKNGVEI